MRREQLWQVWIRTRGHCHFCGDAVVFSKRGWRSGSLRGYWEVDHVIQRGKGGSKSVDNCLPACTRCNRLRWHRKGLAVRELLLLGLIAKDEIKRRSKLGKELMLLRSERLKKNRRRRAKRRK